MADQAEETIYELSDETKAFLEKRKVNRSGVGCALCSLILKDFDRHGRLTDWPNDFQEKGVFPVDAKLKHIELEKGPGVS